MEIITQALTSFLIVMGAVSTILLIIGFVLKAKGSTFVEFFPKKSEVVPQAPNIIYNTITNPSVSNNSYIYGTIQDGNGRIGRLILFKECLKHNIVPFIIEDNLKLFYYRGLKEWDREKGFLMDTCLTAQDRFKAYLDYFRIAY